jgi:hypothetical protein
MSSGRAFPVVCADFAILKGIKIHINVTIHLNMIERSREIYHQKAAQPLTQEQRALLWDMVVSRIPLQFGESLTKSQKTALFEIICNTQITYSKREFIKAWTEDIVQDWNENPRHDILALVPDIIIKLHTRRLAAYMTRHTSAVVALDRQKPLVGIYPKKITHYQESLMHEFEHLAEDLAHFLAPSKISPIELYAITRIELMVISDLLSYIASFFVFLFLLGNNTAVIALSLFVGSTAVDFLNHVLYHHNSEEQRVKQALKEKFPSGSK